MSISGRRRVRGDDSEYGSRVFRTVFRFFASFDFMQLAALSFLLGVGALFVYSTGAQVGDGTRSIFFHRQLLWIGVGFIIYFAAAIPDYRKPLFKVLTVLFYLVVIALLVLVLFIGVRVHGATRWLNVGVLRLQPAEFAKSALILLLASVFSSRLFDINRWPSQLLCVAVTALPLLLIAKEPDFGSSMVLVPIFSVMLFCAGLRWRTLLIVMLLAAGLVTGAVLCELYYRPLLKKYQRNRILTFLSPDSDQRRSGYNVYQSKLAVGSGGLTGKGLSEGTQNALGFLPRNVANNDFIFSVIAEETGFVGSLLLIIGYLLLFTAILRCAFRASEPFGSGVAVGAAAMLFTHVFINIGMSIGLVPVTGLPLPFVSYGGSFVLSGMALLGVLQSIYRHSGEASPSPSAIPAGEAGDIYSSYHPLNFGGTSGK